MSKLQAAVIGTGYLGRFHAQKYAAHPEVDLVGVADLDAECARRVAGECETRPYTGYEDLIDKVDAVSIVVTTPNHFSVARDFLAAGKDVLVEKPFTTTLEEADELIGIARDKGRIIQVGHLERFNPAFLALEGRVTNPLFIEAARISTYKPRALNVGVTLDLMIHDIDLIQGLVGSEPVGVSASGAAMVSEFADAANARLEFAGGCVASVSAGRVALSEQRSIRIFQDGGYILVDFLNRAVSFVQAPKTASGELEVETRTFDQADALAAEIAAFVHSVKTREQPLVSGEVGRAALATALKVTDLVGRNLNKPA